MSISVPSFETFRLHLNFGISQFVSDGFSEHFLVYVLTSDIISYFKSIKNALLNNKSRKEVDLIKFAYD